jgi:hypothetical protein
MSKRPPLLLALLTVCFAGRASAQTSLGGYASHNNLQYGFSIKATLLFDLHRQHPNPYFRIGADAGIASTFIDNWLYPAVNLEFDLYNAGLGTRNNNLQNFGPDLDIVPAFTLTAGGSNRFRQAVNLNRYVSLYYFSNFARPALQNPYDHSFSIGTLWCISTDSAKQSQRIGFLNLNFAAGTQFSYYNDGAPPFDFTSLGDGHDRYHTGGGMLSYNGPKNTLLNTIELSYHKFTGFSQSSFEASNLLYLAFMDYHDPAQKYFNRSQFDLALSNPFRGYGLNVQWYNSVSWDLQHDIHTGVLNTYHMVPYTPPYLTIGLTYDWGNLQTGNR